MEFKLRLAEPDDYPAITALTLGVYLGEGYIPADDPYQVELANSAGRAANAELWVAVSDEKILGSVTFCPPGSSWQERAGAGEAEFRMLAVDPEMRGQGIAQALVEKCIARSRELGCKNLVLSTMNEMKSAHRLYQKLGFIRATAADWEPEPGLCLLAYHKAIT